MKRAGQEGFVLIAVIWFVALLALTSVIMSGWVSSALQNAAALQLRIDRQREFISATEQIAYVMSSSYFNAHGLEVLTGDALAAPPVMGVFGYAARPDSKFIALDGRPYRFGDGVVEMQDSKGLYNINDLDEYTFVHLLEHYGIPLEDRAALKDRLLDYQDKNATVKRLRGATQEDYVRAGWPPPRHQPLITPWEPLRILGWDRYPALWSGPNAFSEMTTLSITSHGLNPNTAPVNMLRSLPGLDEPGVEKLLQYREIGTVDSLAQMQDLTGLAIAVSALQISGFPASTLRARIMFPDDPLFHEVTISLAPVGTAPYRVDYVADLPRNEDVAAILKRPDLPAFPARGPMP